MALPLQGVGSGPGGMALQGFGSGGQAGPYGDGGEAGGGVELRKVAEGGGGGGGLGGARGRGAKGKDTDAKTPLLDASAPVSDQH